MILLLLEISAEFCVGTLPLGSHVVQKRNLKFQLFLFCGHFNYFGNFDKWRKFRAYFNFSAGIRKWMRFLSVLWNYKYLVNTQQNLTQPQIWALVSGGALVNSYLELSMLFCYPYSFRGSVRIRRIRFSRF